MEIIRHHINAPYYAKPIKVELILYDINAAHYLITLEDNTKKYHEHLITPIQDKYILYEYYNGSKLWSQNFIINSNRTIEIITNINYDLIEEYKDSSFGFYHLLSTKNSNLSLFSKFNTNNNYLPTNSLMLTPTNFNINLYEYQKKSLYKMVQIENQETEYTIEYTSNIIFGNKEYKYNPVKNLLVQEQKYLNLKINGGILADEMGLGKTMTTLGLIISNPNTYNCLLYTSPSPRDRQKSRMPSSA